MLVCCLATLRPHGAPAATPVDAAAITTAASTTAHTLNRRSEPAISTPSIEERPNTGESDEKRVLSRPAVPFRAGRALPAPAARTWCGPDGNGWWTPQGKYPRSELSESIDCWQAHRLRPIRYRPFHPQLLRQRMRSRHGYGPSSCSRTQQAGAAPRLLSPSLKASASADAARTHALDELRSHQPPGR